MDTEKLHEEYRQFQQTNEGFAEMMVLTKEGTIMFLTDSTFISEEDARNLMDAWLTRKSAAVIGEDRYPILSWETIQFAARNVKGKGALIGCLTKSDNYIVVHLEPHCKTPPAIAAINLNRWSWHIT
jgi:hypothetical protein